MRPTAQHEVVIGPFRLDRRSRTLVRDGVPFVLGGRALDVLMVLAEAAGETVLKAELLAQAWPGVTVEENNLQVQISVLRKVLGDGWITTIPGVGYRLMTTPGRPDRSAHHRTTGKPSIAVLPFASLGGTARRQLFADGIAEEIITTLSRLSSFFVISRNSSFIYRDRAVDVRQLAHDFGVRYVLEGAVRWGGKQIRVTAQLTDAEVGSNIWAERYDRTLSDILGVQEEISQVVVDALGPAISEAERKRAMMRGLENLDAWEAYQRALWHWSRQGAGSHADVRRYLEKAVTLDHRFAQAHAILAYMHLSDVTRGLHPEPHQSLQRAEDAARTAITLDPDNPGGHATLAWVFTHRGQMGLARDEADLAVTLGPSDPWAHVSRGTSWYIPASPPTLWKRSPRSCGWIRLAPPRRLLCTILASATISNGTMSQRKRWRGAPSAHFLIFPGHTRSVQQHWANSASVMRQRARLQPRLPSRRNICRM